MKITELPMWVQRTPDEDAWIVYHGKYEGPEKHAVNEMQRITQDFIGYVIELRPPEKVTDMPKGNAVIVGTPSSNPLIAQLAQKGLVSVPEEPESFGIASLQSPWAEGKRVIVVAGSDGKGALNGAHAIIARYIKTAPLSPGTFHVYPGGPMANLALFSISESPAIERRGLWTWGDVIHDYRGLIDNLARMRMNYLLMWNNVPPINSKDLIEYAHDRGIEVIYGFSWGWGIEDFDLSSPADREELKNYIIRQCVEKYQPLGLDGIYFQTPTEYVAETIGGQTTASLICSWVNSIADELFEKWPNLYLSAGLHATSIGPNYVDFKDLDPRVSIMWEDAGALPFAYVPRLNCDDSPLMSEGYRPPSIVTSEDTLAYAKKLATFRPGTAFELVPKGIVGVPTSDTGWGGSASHICGERSADSIAKGRLAIRQEVDSFNQQWFMVYPYAMRFYREVLECKPASFTAAGLFQDVMFERIIDPAVALFAETIWDPFRTPEEILQRAMSPYYMNPRI